MSLTNYLTQFSSNRPDFLSIIDQEMLKGKNGSVDNRSLIEDRSIETPKFFQALNLGLLEKKTDFLNSFLNIRRTENLKEALNKNYSSTEAGFKNIISNQSRIRLLYSKNKNTLQSKILDQKNEEVKVLLQDPSLDASILDSHGNTLLHFAALNPNQEIFNLILQKIPDSVNVANNEGFTPLHFAAAENQKNHVRELLKNGGNILASNADTIKNGITPLNFLAFNASKEDPLNLSVLQKYIFALCLLKFLSGNEVPGSDQQTNLLAHFNRDAIILIVYSLSVLSMIKDKAKLIASAYPIKDSVSIGSVGSHILDIAMPSFKEIKDTWSYIGYRNPFSITLKTSLLAFNLFHQITSGMNFLQLGLYSFLSIGEPTNWREKVATEYSYSKGKEMKNIWKNYCNHKNPSKFKLSQDESRFYRKTSLHIHPDKCFERAQPGLENYLARETRTIQFNCLTRNLSQSVSADGKTFTPLTQCMTESEKEAFENKYRYSYIGQVSLRDALCKGL